MLCRICKLQTQRRVIGRTVREVCRNPRCRLHGVPQGDVLMVLAEEEQENKDDTADKA